MKNRWDKRYVYAGITALAVIVLCVLLVFIFIRGDRIGQFFSMINSTMKPIYIGMIIAFLLNPIVMRTENIIHKVWRKCFPKKGRAKEALVRNVSVALILLATLAIFFGLLMMVVPQLYDSVSNLVNSMPSYFENFKMQATETMANYPSLTEKIISYSDTIYEQIMDWLKNEMVPSSTTFLLNLSNGVLSALSLILNIFIGIVISIYILTGKEHFAAQGKKLMFSIFPVRYCNRILYLLRYTTRVFSKFIAGKLIDSLIVGILTFIGLSILNIPYALLISVIIGITNIIPFFGPYIGIVPSIVLILLTNPIKCIPFLIFIIILMQFDGNILGPKILGESIGLSSFWILASILVFGNIFGLLGMICAVPIFAVFYALVTKWSELRLKKKSLPSNTKQYERLNEIDQDTGQPSYLKKRNEDVKNEKK